MHPTVKSRVLGVLLGLLAIMQVQAQIVTAEGNPPFDTSSAAMTITLTDAAAPSGSKPTNYYSSVYPQSITALPRYFRLLDASFCERLFNSYVTVGPAQQNPPLLLL
jgi:hypothetical protein